MLVEPLDIAQNCGSSVEFDERVEHIAISFELLHCSFTEAMGFIRPSPPCLTGSSYKGVDNGGARGAEAPPPPPPPDFLP